MHASGTHYVCVRARRSVCACVEVCARACTRAHVYVCLGVPDGTGCWPLLEPIWPPAIEDPLSMHARYTGAIQHVASVSSRRVPRTAGPSASATITLCACCWSVARTSSTSTSSLTQSSTTRGWQGRHPLPRWPVACVPLNACCYVGALEDACCCTNSRAGLKASCCGVGTAGRQSTLPVHCVAPLLLGSALHRGLQRSPPPVSNARTRCRAHVCNDVATLLALKGGVDPTHANALDRISLLVGRPWTRRDWAGGGGARVQVRMHMPGAKPANMWL